MRKTEPWWVCHKCGAPVKKVGKRSKTCTDAMLEHRKVCGPMACFSIEQIEQRKRKKQ